jgi:pilus assembly protein TadC
VVEVAAVLDLLEVAFAAGMSVPGALDAVGRAVGGPRGRAMSGVAAAVTLGAGWEEAWCAPGEGPMAAGPSAGGGLGPVADALRATWEDGVPPRAAVRAAAGTLRRERHARALEAAARLGVRLVLPLGLCYLPAFVLVGLVPVVVSMAAGVLAP